MQKLFGNLYESIYKNNIEEVWNILEKYPISCRKNFLKNIKKTSFEHTTRKHLQEMTKDREVNALLIPQENKIYLNGFENTKAEINHELFHVASFNNKAPGIIANLIIDNKIIYIGDHLNEGITEYLALKSIKKEEVESSYGQEVFTIDSLIKIYGKNILIPYFENKPIKFYRQFKNNQSKIIELDLLLKEISTNINIKNIFDEFIIIRDLKPLSLKKEKIYLENLNINKNNIEKFNHWLDTKENIIHASYDNLIEEKENENIEYILNEENDKIYHEWLKEYTSVQKELFERIIKIIIILSRKKGIKEQTIKKNIINSLKNIDIALDMIEYKNKLLIKKK